jgi:transcriptional regulator with XRE-family HTH domain
LPATNRQNCRSASRIVGQSSRVIEVRWDRVAGQPEAFGELVRRARVAGQLTQEALAERTGLSVRAISNIERSRTTRPHRASVLQIAEVLGLDQAKLEGLTDEDERPASPADRGSRPAPRPADPAAADEGEPLPVPRQLPAGIAHFVGRAAELEG